MSNISIRLNHQDASKLNRYIDSMMVFASNPDTLLKRIGAYYTGEMKAEFSNSKQWPKKLFIFENWERSGDSGGNRNKPLTYRGALMQSITWAIEGGILVVGSPLPYASTHQFGWPEPHKVWFSIVPDIAGIGPRGGKQIKMFPGTQIPMGRLTIWQDKNAIHIPLMIQPRPRPFAKEPNAQQMEDIFDICEQVLLNVSGLGKQGHTSYFGPGGEA